MQDFETKYSETIKFLKNSGISSPNKPAVPHDLRAGKILFEKGFDDEVVIAGILHDVLEWSPVTEEELKEEFGEKVLQLVKVNSKDRSIKDKEKRRKNQIKRCLEVGEDALAIKIADNLDSFEYYSKMKKEKELQRCRDWAKLIMNNISLELKNKFESELNKIINKTN